MQQFPQPGLISITWYFMRLWGCTSCLLFSNTLVVYGVLEYFSKAFFLKKFLIAMLCFFITSIGLGTGFSGAISSVITAVYVCYAIERRDGGEISKPEVCHVFMITAPSLLPESEATKLQGV